MLPNYTFLLSKKKKKEKQFHYVHCLPANPLDISPDGMGIWVRLNTFVFGVVAPR